MSVFRTIKETIFSVPQDITSSFRSFTKKDSSTAEDGVEEDGINIDAGSELLNSFQEDWSQIHSHTEENSKSAQKVDGQINELFLYLERQNDAMNQFYSEVSNLPKLIGEVKEVMDKIGELEGLFSDVEKDIAELEDISEQVELSNNKMHHERQLQMYQQRKNADLEQIKVNLAAQHAGKVQQYETKLQKNLLEKQQAFSEVYSEEMKRYKEFGTTELKPSPPSKTRISLAEVTFDEDPSALDDFLKSADDQAAAGSSDIPVTNDCSEPASEQKSDKVDMIKVEDSDEIEEEVTAIEIKQDSEDIDSDDTKPVGIDSSNSVDIHNKLPDKNQDQQDVDSPKTSS